MAIEDRMPPNCDHHADMRGCDCGGSVSTVLRKLQDRYQLVDQKLEQLLSMPQHDWNEELTGDILEQVNEIQQLSAQASELSRVRETATAAEESPTAVSERIKTIETMFRDMLGKIALMERTVQEARDQLLPQVNAGVRALQVRRAYSGT